MLLERLRKRMRVKAMIFLLERAMVTTNNSGIMKVYEGMGLSDILKKATVPSPRTRPVSIGLEV